jgi:hypothetical protein
MRTQKKAQTQQLLMKVNKRQTTLDHQQVKSQAKEAEIQA